MVLNLRSARMLWLQLHKWLALTIGFFVALLGLTGALLVFKEPLLNWEIGRDVLQTEVRDAPFAPVEDWIAQARQAYPEVSRIVLVAAPYGSPLSSNAALLLAYLGDDDIRFISVDPYTSKPMGSFGFREGMFFFFILEIHRHLLIPFDAGEVVVAMCGIVLLLSIISGVYLWYPRAGRWAESLRLQPALSGRRFLINLHSVAAIYLFIPLALIALSGIYLAQPGWIEPVIAVFSPTRVPDPMMMYEDMDAHDAQDAACKENVTPGEAVALATSAADNATLATLTLPMKEGGRYTVWLKHPNGLSDYGDVQVVVSSRCRKVVSVLDNAAGMAGDRIKASLRPLHARLMLGTFGSVVAFIAGAILPLLFVTGVLSWWRSRKART